MGHCFCYLLYLCVSLSHSGLESSGVIIFPTNDLNRHNIQITQQTISRGCKESKEDYYTDLKSLVMGATMWLSTHMRGSLEFYSGTLFCLHVLYIGRKSEKTVHAILFNCILQLPTLVAFLPAPLTVHSSS